jgi:hypothetical protein
MVFLGWLLVCTVNGYAAVTLEAYYTFDDTVADDTANHADAALVGDTAFSTETPAPIAHSTHSLEVQPGGTTPGGATLPFSVSSDVLEAGAFSISLWARTHATLPLNKPPGPGEPANLVLLNKWDTAVWPDADWILQLHHGDGDHMELISPTFTLNKEVPPPLSTDTWAHVVMTNDGSNNWTFYVDNSDPVLASSAAPNTGDSLWLGYNTEQPDNPLWSWDGEIDDVAIYSGVLNSIEVEALFSGADPANPGLSLGDFNFDTVVDLVDYGLLRDHVNAHLDGPVGYGDGDIDLDGDVDLEDFGQFKALFPGVTAAATSVPEPSSLALGLGALTGIAALVRRRPVPARHIEN